MASFRKLFVFILFSFTVITLVGMGFLTKAVLDIKENVTCYNLENEEKIAVDKITTDKIAAAKAAADKKVADDKAAADKKIADDKAAADKIEADKAELERLRKAAAPAAAFSNIPNNVNTIDLSDSQLTIAKIAIVCFWILLFFAIFGIKLIF
jgi:hypothetical protein